jgi:hypothetical protein
MGLACLVKRSKRLGGGELVTFLQGVGVGAVDREEGGVGVLVTIVEMMEERLKDLGRSLVSILSLSL